MEGEEDEREQKSGTRNNIGVTKKKREQKDANT